MKFAYADPPYLGLASHYDHPEAGSYNFPDAHHRLIVRLSDEFPDGWALSLHSPSLRVILPMCPNDVRVGAWVKPFCSFKPGVNPAYAWEPVIFRGGRKRASNEETGRDWCSVSIALRHGLVGAKPEAFCFWLFRLLGMQPCDELADLFPGSGAVERAWQTWKSQQTLALVSKKEAE